MKLVSLTEKLEKYIAAVLAQPLRRRSYQKRIYFWPVYIRIMTLQDITPWGEEIGYVLATQDMALCQIGNNYVICKTEHLKKVSSMTVKEFNDICQAA